MEGRHGSAAIDDLRPLLGRPIAFYRCLPPLTGGAKSALMLSQMLYWTCHGSEISSSDGWFYKTAEQWERETGLSLRGQRSSRDNLVNLGFVEERRTGLPAKLHFRVNLDRLEQALDTHPGARAGVVAAGESGKWVDRLGPVSAFYARLTAVTGSVTTAMALSRSIVLARHEHTDPEGWIGKLPEAWLRESGLTLAQYHHARQRLRELGLWSVVLRSFPAHIHVRVEWAVLKHRLERSRDRPERSRENDTHSPQNAQSSLQQCANLDPPKPPDMNRRSAETSLIETPEPNRDLTTGLRLQKPPPPARETPVPSPRGGDDLIFPSMLSADQRLAASAMLAAVPAFAQDLLDELAARIAMNGVRTTPIRYLRGLVARAKLGEFVLEAGVQVRAQRRQREGDEAIRRSQHAEAKAMQARRQSPEYQATIERRREDIRRFLAQSGLRRRSSPSMAEDG
jgi:hypothetical protein